MHGGEYGNVLGGSGRSEGCKLLDVRLTYTDLMGEGGDSAVTEAQTVEKKPSCVHDPGD